MDPIAIHPPSEDLGPLHFVGMTRLVGMDQHQRVVRGIGQGEALRRG
jgi:hypothetical protein